MTPKTVFNKPPSLMLQRIKGMPIAEEQRRARAIADRNLCAKIMRNINAGGDSPLDRNLASLIKQRKELLERKQTTIANKLMVDIKLKLTESYLHKLSYYHKGFWKIFHDFHLLKDIRNARSIDIKSECLTICLRHLHTIQEDYSQRQIDKVISKMKEDVKEVLYG